MTKTTLQEIKATLTEKNHNLHGITALFFFFEGSGFLTLICTGVISASGGHVVNVGNEEGLSSPSDLLELPVLLDWSVEGGSVEAGLVEEGFGGGSVGGGLIVIVGFPPGTNVSVRPSVVTVVF